MRPGPLPRPEPSPGRRVLLGGALGAVAVALTGCGVRLEDDAPPLPLIPTREPIPAESALLWLLADCRDLADGEGPQSDLYAEQAAVLRSGLFRAGVPIEALDAVVTPPETASPTSPAASSTPTSAPTSTTPDGADPDPAAALARTADLAECGPGIFPVVMSLLAQRWAAVTLARGGTPEGLQADSALLWRFGRLAAGFVEPTSAAIYGFEIVAAQSRNETRDAAVTTLTDLRRLRREQAVRAGGQAVPPDVGYALPFPVDSEESALRLATHVLTGLTDAYGGLVLTVTGAAQQDAAADVVAWLGAAAAHAVGWGAPLAAFPGTHASP